MEDSIQQNQTEQPDANSSAEKEGKITFSQTVVQINHTVGGEKKKQKKLTEVHTSSEHIWHLDGMTMRQKRDYPATKIVSAPL